MQSIARISFLSRLSACALFALSLGAASAALILPPSAGPVSAADKSVDRANKKHPGRTVYRRKTCLACHGKEGRKAIQDYPNLAGQDAAYMENQIEDILSGARSSSPDATGHPRTEGMRGALTTPEGDMRLSKQEIKDVSEWLASLEPAAPKEQEPLSDAQRKAGEKLYRKYQCQVCHGKEGKKPKKAHPYIAGQKRSYIINQIKDIREKIRTNGLSKTMVPFSKRVSDEDIEILADYLSRIDRRG